MLAAYRNRHARRFRELVLADTDLFLAATERAALALELEGVPAERIVVCPPGIDTSRFAPHAAGASPTARGGRAERPRVHTIVSPGRLVWEKGHQDVLRALALLHRGIVRDPGAARRVRPRLLIVGAGPEGGAAARARRGSRAERRGGDPQRPLRARCRAVFAAGLGDGARQPGRGDGCAAPVRRPARLLGGAVRARARRGDGRRAGDRHAPPAAPSPRSCAGRPSSSSRPGDWPAIARALAGRSAQRAPAARAWPTRRRS